MNVGDLLLIQPIGILASKAVNFPMWYRVNSLDNPSEASFTTMARAIAENVAESLLIEKYLVTVSSSVDIRTIKILNQFNVLENYEGDAEGMLPAAGEIAGESLPTYDAFAFYTGTSRRDIRSGARRWPGIVEAQQSGGILAGGVLSALGDLCSEMSVTRIVSFVGGGLVSLQPVIVKRVKTIDLDTGKVRYNLPTSQEDFQYYGANQWIVRTFTTTQRTRKRATS